MFKSKINQILNNQIFEKGILLLIFLNLLIFVLDTINDFHNAFNAYIKAFEVFSIAVFTFEYILRLFTINNFRDLFKPAMLIDFWAIFPYYLSFFIMNTMYLRIFRLLRIVRVLKIGRYSEALDNIKNGFKEKKEELIITFSIFCIGILISSILLYFAENEAQPQLFSSIPKCFYFAVITFTSVGYGDISPITSIGKIICSVIAVLGIGLHGLFVGVIGTAFMQAFRKD